MSEKKRKEANLETLRHSTSHVMAQAVQDLFPGTKLAIGPSIEDGFYYDFDAEESFKPEDLPRIEARMREIVKEDLPFDRVEMAREEAIDFFRKRGAEYKVEIIEGIEDPNVSLYRHGPFVDLCRGPHLGSTGEIGAFRLLTIAGAYWRGDVGNPMLQRIYGTAFFDRASLKEHLRLVEEAKKRDHRKLGKELDLFSFHSEAPGSPFYHPKGLVLYNTLVDFWRKVHAERGYREIFTPTVLREGLWHRSGHWDHYKDHMFLTEIGGERFAVKPMNCPGGLLLYGESLHSYREFPLRVAELGRVHRRELSGVLHGLFRAQSFVIDDAHIFCLPEQLRGEIIAVIQLVLWIYRVMGFEDHFVELSTRPESSIGSDGDWDRATDALRGALDDLGIPFEVREGEGAFYGPKIDFHIRDCLKRSWQCGTIQVDFSMPERFDLEYVGPDGGKHRPVMIHRAVLGSLERFLGVLIEHYGGAFPVWLSPVQAVVVPVAQAFGDYAESVGRALRAAGIRAEEDLRNESLSLKVREAQIKKVPYTLIVGKREQEAEAVTVRRRREKKQEFLPLGEFAENIGEEIESKRSNGAV